MVPVVLSDFQPVELSQPLPQTLSAEYMAWLIATAECVQDQVEQPAEAQSRFEVARNRVQKYAVNENMIRQRQLNAIPAGLSQTQGTPELPSFLRDSLADDPAGDTIDERHDLYRSIAGRAIDEAYAEVETAPDDMIHVTCSGYLAPSPAETFVSGRGWKTTVTHSYHMGCYGAFPAVRMATGVLGASLACMPKPKQRVDVMHTELLSAHFNILDQSAGNIINSTLFADGFIRYSASLEQEGSHGLKILAADEVYTLFR